ncbi:MAG: undecaprenyl-diphosphate phosphatase [Magnetospirillum sp.]|nr:undecaprenyl-diphosphate phosphatase [Magnetospirillum sp.]
MTLLDMVIFALFRGIAEVLPISASGHLAFLPGLSPDGRDASAAVAAAADLGIAAALALYFWRDVLEIGSGLWKLAKGRPDGGSRAFLRLAAAAVPALVLGWTFARLLGAAATTPHAAAVSLLVFGLFLLAGDRLGVRVKRIEHMSYRGAFAIGLLQAAAAVPGISRVGITITAQRLMGYERPASARFSLLLLLPSLVFSASAEFWQAHRAGLTVSADLALAAVVAGIAALLAVAGLMAWVETRSYAPFALWRILVGGGLLTRALLG